MKQILAAILLAGMAHAANVCVDVSDDEILAIEATSKQDDAGAYLQRAMRSTIDNHVRAYGDRQAADLTGRLKALSAQDRADVEKSIKGKERK